MTDVVIASAVRTPIGKFQGTLAQFTAPQLGTQAIKAAIGRAGLQPGDVQETIMGCVLTAGVGQAPARQAQRGAGIPDHTSAFTVNKVCGSGLKSVVLAGQAIKCGDAEIIVAGGMECMSRAPYMLPDAREGMRLGHSKIVDSMIADGLWDPYYDMHMGLTAEAVCKEYSVDRGAQDAWAVESHRRAVAAQKSGAFRSEIAPVEIKPRKGDPFQFDTDEGPRADATAEALGKLKPAFDKTGSVTAGNASTINDGAAALVVMSADAAKAKGIKPLAKIAGYASGGTDPKWVMMAPIEAVKNLEAKTGRALKDYDLIELNEAFASQVVYCRDKLGMDPEKLNVNGGSISIGHPYGMTGSRLTGHLARELKRRGKRYGIITMCVGGGQGAAGLIEAV